jgi:hypothetical protein
MDAPTSFIFNPLKGLVLLDLLASSKGQVGFSARTAMVYCTDPTSCTRL